MPATAQPPPDSVEADQTVSGMGAAGDVLRRMIRAANGGGKDDNGRLPAALALAAGKAAQQLFDAEGGFEAAAESLTNGVDVLAQPPEPVLLMLPETATGRCGLMWFDPVLVNALVEMMTGAPDRMVYLDRRVPTQIDMALCRDFARAFLLELGSALEGAPPLDFTRQETDRRKLKYTLEEGPYRMITGRIDFQNGVRGGEMGLALPVDLWQPQVVHSGDGAGAEWSAALAGNVGQAPLGLVAELAVVSMPVARAIGLQPGDIVPVPAASLSDLTLMTSDGVHLFKGHLGQKDGNKAVSLSHGAPGVILKPENPPEDVADVTQPDIASQALPAAPPEGMPDVDLSSPSTSEPT